jgi:hypothetical protein
MLFGLWNAGQTFHRPIDRVLAGLPYCFVYIDDVLAKSPSPELHLQHLEEVLTQLQQHHSLVFNVGK